MTAILNLGEIMKLEELLGKFKNWLLTEGLKLVVGLIVLYFTFKIINLITKKIDNKLKNKKKNLDETITKVSFSVLKNFLKILEFVCFLGYV